MTSPSLTLRLTAIFTLIMALACGGIRLILYKALRSELVWRDDQTLINRAAQLRQLLEDGAHPSSLPLYFNRMVDIHQDILSIRSQHAQNVSINHTGITLPAISPTPVSAPPSEKQLHRWINADKTEASALSLQANSLVGPVTITLARVARERAPMLERYRQQSILVSLAAILLCAAVSPLLIRRGLRAIGRLSKIVAETASDRLSRRSCYRLAMRLTLCVSTYPRTLSVLPSLPTIWRTKSARPLMCYWARIRSRWVMNAQPLNIRRCSKATLKSWRVCRVSLKYSLPGSRHAPQYQTQ